MENRSCQYVEREKSTVCGKRLISAQRGKYFTVSMWKKPYVCTTWKIDIKGDMMTQMILMEHIFVNLP